MEICRAKFVTNCLGSLGRRARYAWVIIGVNERILLAFGRGGLGLRSRAQAAIAIHVMKG